MDINIEEIIGTPEGDLLEEFRRDNFAHISVEEFFKRRQISMKKYRDIHLSVQYQELADSKNRIHYTELALMREALANGCAFVTEADYCGSCIAARGWTLR